MTVPRPAIERMMKRKVVDDDGCWVWPGATNKVSDYYGGGNYGQIRENGVTLMVHRVAYEHYVGPIPVGLVIDHECHNDSNCSGNGCKHRRCWNPEHLRLKSFCDNCAAGMSPGAITKRTGICKRGHEQTDENVWTWMRPSGTIRRACRICAHLSRARIEAVRRGHRASI